MTVIAPAGFRALPLSLAQLSLAAVLKCGQSFRWSILPLHTPTSALDVNESDGIEDQESSTHEYRLCLRDRVVCLQQSPRALFYRSYFPDPQPNPSEEKLRDAETLAWIRDYFQLEVDLEVLYKEWATNDAVFAKFQDRFQGIRMLRQDPWENLVSYVGSHSSHPITFDMSPIASFAPRTIIFLESPKWFRICVSIFPRP